MAYVRENDKIVIKNLKITAYLAVPMIPLFSVSEQNFNKYIPNRDTAGKTTLVSLLRTFFNVQAN